MSNRCNEEEENEEIAAGGDQSVIGIETADGRWMEGESLNPKD